MKIIQMTNATPTQTMGYVVQAKTGQVLVIDGGAKDNDKELKRIIKSVGSHVDLWLITHPHSDHHDAIMQVLRNPEGITYDRLGASRLSDEWAESTGLPADAKELIAWNAFAKNLDSRYFDIKNGEVFNLGSMKVEILAVANPEILDNPFNNQSVVIRVTEDGFVMLFLGDLGIEAGEKLLKTGIDLHSDGCQLAHHGQQGVNEKFYQAVKPTYAFWATPDWLWDNTPYLGGTPGTGPFKTQETAGWMKKLNTVNIFSFKHSTVFDTETKQFGDY